MRTRRKFTPSLQSSELEKRIVLSGYHGPNRMGAAVLLQRLHGPARPFRPHAPVPTPGQASVASLVDLSYQSFQQDYGAVRATYLSAVANGTAIDKDKEAFDTYTTQRVGLLAQEVTNSFLLYAASATRGKRSDSALPLVIRSISGGAADGRMNSPRRSESLVSNLTKSTPAPDSSATTVALSTIAQDNAIEASRVSTLNGVTIIRNGAFGSRSKH